MKSEPTDGMDARQAEALRSLATEEARRLTNHPGVEVLAAYSDGRLAPDEEDRVQEHLAFCRDCAAQVADAAHLASEPLDQTTAGPGEVAIEALWRAQRRRFEVAPDLPVRTGGWRTTAPPWIVAVAASLLFAVVALSVWVHALRSTLAVLSSPQLNTPVEVLMPEAFLRDTEEQRAVIELPAGASSLTLVLSFPEREIGDGYALEVATGDEVRWQNRGLVRNSDGSFTVTFVRSWLSPGRYQLRLFAVNDTELQLLATYAVDIQQAPDEGS